MLQWVITSFTNMAKWINTKSGVCEKPFNEGMWFAKVMIWTCEHVFIDISWVNGVDVCVSIPVCVHSSTESEEYTERFDES